MGVDAPAHAGGDKIIRPSYEYLGAKRALAALRVASWRVSSSMQKTEQTDRQTDRRIDEHQMDALPFSAIDAASVKTCKTYFL